MEPNRIRPIAICVIFNAEKILVSEGFDTVKRETFYRPLGGRIEFGERGAETVAREFREELGAEVTALYFLGTLESIFTHNGENGHEIVLVYTGKLVDKQFHTQDRIEAVENEGWVRVALWKPLAEFANGNARLYPDGLVQLLSGSRHANVTADGANIES